jgi:hypothetical protein
MWCRFRGIHAQLEGWIWPRSAESSTGKAEYWVMIGEKHGSDIIIAVICLFMKFYVYIYLNILTACQHVFFWFGW